MNKSILFVGALAIIGIGAYAYGSRQSPVVSVVPDPSDYVSDTLTYDIAPSSVDAVEREGLLYMREEEKLARDVYIALYEKWQQPAFANIAGSESTHMASVLRVLETYDIPDPVGGNGAGEFTNPELQALYHTLVAQGNTSLMDALTVGAMIEDLDILDLQKRLPETDNADIQRVYENLMKGSRNHLRSFVGLIEARGGSYTAHYLPQTEIDTILATPKERGPIR